MMLRFLRMMRATELNLWHMVLGFIFTTIISVLISVALNNLSMIQNQKLQEVNSFVSSSKEFDNTTREYVRAVITKSSEQEAIKQRLIGNIQKQYGDLQVAKTYLGPNGIVAAEKYRESLLELTKSLRSAESLESNEIFFENLNNTLQLRKTVEYSLRKTANLPAEPPSEA